MPNVLACEIEKYFLRFLQFFFLRISSDLSMASTTTNPGAERQQIDKSLYNYVFRSMKRSHDMFAHDRDKFVEGVEKA